MAKQRLRYAYDAVGNRSLLVDPDGGRFTYAYDSLNRISHLENPHNERTTYAYDAGGRRTVKKLANGTRASFTYDDASNLTRLANLKSDTTTISSFDYAYDKTGNRTAVLETDGSRVTWSYDGTYQLTGEHRTGSNAYRNTFTYDAAGNRTLKNESGARTTYSYDNANQLKTSVDSLGTTTYTFDADGNQQIVKPPTGPRTTTTWDYENRTTLVELSSGLRNTMAYEPDGLRVKLEDSTGTKKFVWDDQNYLAETDDTDTTQVVYTNEPRRYGNLLSQRRGSTTHWYHFDAIGSTRELTLVSEAASDTYLYDAWGVPIAATGATTNPFRFVGALGYYFDVDSNNNYVRARTYQPAIARWTSIDPLANRSPVVIAFLSSLQPSSSHSLYRLLAPVTYVDPSGQKGDKCSGGTAKAFPLKEAGVYKVEDNGVLLAGLVCLPFYVTAKFEKPCCDCCEFRQYIKDNHTTYIVNTKTKKIVETVEGSSSTEFEEDCHTDDEGNEICYGHDRAGGTNTSLDQYCPKRVDGCTYRSFDCPGFALPITEFAKLEKDEAIYIVAKYEFSFRIYDTCQDMLLPGEVGKQTIAFKKTMLPDKSTWEKSQEPPANDVCKKK